MEPSAISARGLSKTYHSRGKSVDAISNLDIELHTNECIGLLGPNGAGKSTLLDMLAGLTTPTTGELEVLGRRWKTDEKELRERIGVTFQESRFSGKSTASETLRLFRSFYRSGLEPHDVLRLVGLESKSNSYVETLSGGQQKRLEIAVALVGDPELIFLDEPTSGLDPQSRSLLKEILLELQNRGRTIVLATHSIDDAENQCDRVAIIDHGRLIALGRPAELIAQLGGENVIEFSVAGDGPRRPASSYADLPSVSSARDEDDGCSLTVQEHFRVIPALIERLNQQGLTLGRLTTRNASLADVFISLTGHSLREDDSDTTSGGKSPRRRRTWWQTIAGSRK